MTDQKNNHGVPRVPLESKVIPRFIWYGMFLGYVQDELLDGALRVWFSDSTGGAGYLLRIEKDEWRAA